MRLDPPDRNGVTNADIDEALRRMRQANGGHEPWAMGVYDVALQVAKERMDAQAKTQA